MDRHHRRANGRRDLDRRRGGSRFVDLHALALESNYDRRMQLESDRPWFLKRRIMDGLGHLSNEQALEAIEHIESQSHLSRIALLHISRHCNCPNLLRELYVKRAPHLVDRLTLSHHAEPTPLLEVVPGQRRSTPAVRRQVQAMLFSHAIA